MLSPNDQLSRRLQPARIRALFALVGCLALGGCTYSGGELLYFLGFGRAKKVTAKFRLTEGPIMILVDDASQCVDWPMAARYLVEGLSQELIKHKAAGKIIPHQTVEHLRQSFPDFEKRGCREIGQHASAEQVIWIEVRDFLAEEQIVDIGIAAYFTVTVKVINVLEEKSPSRVRLWPTTPKGYLVTVSMNGNDVARAKTKDAISKELAGRLAVDVAKLFYDHRLGDFERER